MAMRRSAIEPISQSASAIMSAAKATGSAWKLPPEKHLAVVGEDQRIVGDAVRLDHQRRRRLAQEVEAAPITCGWQRRQYGSCTRSSP